MCESYNSFWKLYNGFAYQFDKFVFNYHPFFNGQNNNLTN
jgi:hypothetical protein